MNAGVGVPLAADPLVSLDPIELSAEGLVPLGSSDEIVPVVVWARGTVFVSAAEEALIVALALLVTLGRGSPVPPGVWIELLAG